jgi:Inorganic pyrophosphatase
VHCKAVPLHEFLYYFIADLGPIDVFILGNSSLLSKSVISCRPVGVLLTEDQGGIDPKVIAVPLVSSVLALLHRSLSAAVATIVGFAVMFVAAILIVSSLACRLPLDFFMIMMLVPFIVVIIVIVALHMYSERKRTSLLHR